MTLLKETRAAIKESHHKITDIIFIGSEKSGHECTWAEFKELADYDYDGGFGGQVVANDLIIVFKDREKLWRSEYDGSEWWDFSTPFKEPKEKKKITELFTEIGWATLEELSWPGGKYGDN